MYRKRQRGSRKYNEKLKAMLEGRERKRLEGPPPEYPDSLPDGVLREIIIIDRIGPTTTHHFKLHASRRRADSFQVEVDGQPIEVMG